ncbi:MAG: argininosuccinate lyase [Deltaproteobacteria bacterium]|nr:argininosuccinate lyase [Deltaproteobacteria bacterium]
MTRQGKPWGGRFREPTDAQVEQFTASIAFDKLLYRYDIEGSIAHARMLSRQGIITAGDERAIIKGLKAVLADMEKERFDFSTGDEDVHMAIEKALIRKIGKVGGKLHTGRSRNDQVALDVRLYLRDEISRIIDLMTALKRALVRLAKQESKTIMPGYTHLQKAQPVLLAHYLLAHWEMLDRDEARLRDCRERVNVMPLGAAALAGTGLPIDRAYTARLLKFPRIAANSMDAVSDRDFVAEFIFAASLVLMHLSRFCEDLIIWSSDEFGFVEMADAFTTGSSIMPQKKNPDVAELIRGKTARTYGNLISMLTLLKGLPLTYNRDLQEDKEPLFDTVDTVKSCVAIFAGMIGCIKFNRERMREGATGGFSVATDVAEYLVKKGVPFRESHGIVGRLVAYCLEKGKDLPDLTMGEMRRFYKGFAEDVYVCLMPENAVNAKRSLGGTSPKMVTDRIRAIEGTSARKRRK